MSRKIIGDGEDNFLDGNRRDNYMDGRGGNDTLKGGRGDDINIGGNGDDVFVFNKGHDQDTIRDFTSGRDQIDLNGFGLGSFEALSQLFEQVGDNVVINFGRGDVLTIENILIADLSGTDFF